MILSYEEKIKLWGKKIVLGIVCGMASGAVLGTVFENEIAVYIGFAFGFVPGYSSHSAKQFVIVRTGLSGVVHKIPILEETKTTYLLGERFDLEFPNTTEMPWRVLKTDPAILEVVIEI